MELAPCNIELHASSRDCAGKGSSSVIFFIWCIVNLYHLTESHKEKSNLASGYWVKSYGDTSEGLSEVYPLPPHFVFTVLKIKNLV